MPFVVDASVVAAWALANETNERAERLFGRAQTEGALTSTLLWFEIRNILLIAERRNRIGQRDADQFLVRLEKLPITQSEQLRSRELMRLARSHGLTAYDASYLELAIREQVALATFDRKLSAAAIAEGLPVLLD